MVDTSKIHALIAQARRRLRLQAAFESATTAAVLAFPAALIVVYGVRQEVLSTGNGFLLLGGCAALIVLGAVMGAIRTIPTYLVAARIDRVCGLAGRLSAACAFEGELRGDGREPRTERDPMARELMLAAIRDADAQLPKADAKAATPFSRPRDGRAALAFAVVSVLVAGLWWPGLYSDADTLAQSQDKAAQSDAADANRDAFIDEDLEYARGLAEDLRRVAQAERDPSLEEFADEVADLLARAEQGEISKEALLEGLAKAEERYSKGADDNIEESLSELAKTGRELDKNPITRELGKALQRGDLAEAQKQLEAIAEKLDQGQLDEKQQQTLAKTLERAADKFDKRDSKQDAALEQQIEQAQKEMRRLQRKREDSRNEAEKRRLTRRLEKKKRELKRLERQKEERQSSERRRTLKRLHRNLQKAAESMKKNQEQQQQQQKNGNQQEQQQNRRMASRDLRNAAQDTGKVDADRRKITNRKKVASQVTDLREALRRARRRQQNGPRDLFGKNRRNLDFNQRARGGQGSRQSWRPGRLGKGQRGPGQQPGGQGQQGQKGQQPGSSSYGEGHDPNVLGDATPRSGNTKDESLSGVHGRGPSRRQTILAAAQKGFASRSYEQVFAEYKAVIEEVMRTEKVPSGYKYYVKRYFQKIKPHSMD